MEKNSLHSHPNSIGKILKITACIFWAALIIFFIANYSKISIDSIVNLTPENKISAALIILAMFALKSVSIVIYCGILYAAAGLIFPIPIAILISTIGTFIMTSIPFFIGRYLGKDKADKLIKKYPRLRMFAEMQTKNEFFLSFFTRILGLLPSDILSMYCGASSFDYGRYIFGAVLGFMPDIALLTVMGMGIKDMSSPSFIIAACIKVALSIISLLFVLIRNKIEKAR